MSASRAIRRSPPPGLPRLVGRRTPVVLAILAGLLAGCEGGSGPQRGNAFVFLSVVQFSLTGSAPVGLVKSSLADAGASTLVCARLRSDLKNPTQTKTTALDDIRIRSYTVTFTRLDGGPPPGPFTFNTAVLVPAGEAVSFPVVLVPAVAKLEPPLRPLGPRLPMSTSASVVFRGEDGRGQRAETEGGLALVFVGEGTDKVPACAGGDEG